MNDARIVRHHVEKVFRLLERADDRVVRPFQNANDAPFRAVAAFRPRVTFIARDSCDDLVAVHRRPGVFGGDVKIGLAFFTRKKRESGLMNRKRSGHEVRFRREDVTVLANPRDLAIAFHFAQDRVEIHPDAALAAQRFAELDLVERPVVRRAQQIEDSFAELSALWFHKVCTLRVISLGHEGKVCCSDAALSAY